MVPDVLPGKEPFAGGEPPLKRPIRMPPSLTLPSERAHEGGAPMVAAVSRLVYVGRGSPGGIGVLRLYMSRLYHGL